MAAVRTNFVTAEISHTITTYTLQWRGKVCSHFAPHLGRHKFRDPFAAPTQPFKDPRLATRQARNAITAEMSMPLLEQHRLLDRRRILPSRHFVL
jgi:hypothetical protein